MNDSLINHFELPKKVRVVEVGPRDGLQNESHIISADIKIQLINLLSDAGIDYIEAGSFVNPKWVPQMSDSEFVFNRIDRKPNTTYAALIPNLIGFEKALAANANEVAIFAAASEAFSQKNINCSIAESLNRFEQVTAAAKKNNMPVRGYISCVASCPYSGTVAPELVRDIAIELKKMGCREISLGDTIGTATPEQIKNIIRVVSQSISIEYLAVHLHDTYGQAIANVYAALQMGVSVVDSSIAGLGGCPYAPGAAGNLATEDLIYLLDGLGIAHGVNFSKLLSASEFICAALGKQNKSKAAQALLRKN